MKRMKKNNKGFSLVELIIVIAIMAILAGILIPQFVRYIANSRVSGDIQQAENIYNAVAAQFADDGVAGAATLTYDGELHVVDAAVAGTLGMGNTAPTCKVDSAQVFYYSCTAQGVVGVYIGAAGATGAPNIAAGGNVTQISPSIEGPNASDWGGTDAT